ncbi:hypothetical protein EJB05_31402, partial [Eragrostis curvula]
MTKKRQAVPQQPDDDEEPKTESSTDESKQSFSCGIFTIKAMDCWGPTRMLSKIANRECPRLRKILHPRTSLPQVKAISCSFMDALELKC